MATMKQKNDAEGDTNLTSAVDCIDISRALGVPVLPVAISLMGTLVRVQTREDKWFEGVFKAVSPKFDFCLEVAHQLEPGREEDLPRQSTVRDKLIFKLEDVVRIEGVPDLDSVVKSGFATDSEISRANNGAVDAARELEPWEPDAGGEEDDQLAAENNGSFCDGWSAEAMFLANEQRFLYKSDYDERLYHTADVKFDPENEIDQERARRAREIAREIERNPASKRAAELENDDEERDIVPRSSGSSANNSAVTTPTSATAPGAQNRYVPPNKRIGGGERGGRNTRRGGAGGAPFQSSIRNQQGGDSRFPPRQSGRDYPDSGGYPIGTSYYGQRPHRLAQQHHQMMAQTSHERGPMGPGPGPASNNEWERAKGSKRHDIRDNYGGPHPAGPPQVPSMAQVSRPPPTGPPRQHMDGAAAKGRRGVDELKDFSKNFQLRTQEQPTGGPIQSEAAQSTPPSVTTPASASMQVQRLPAQSSPTQPQLPPQTTSMPPPQQHQRRSPDSKNQSMSNYGGMNVHKTGPPPAAHHPHPPHHANQNQSKMHNQISPVQTQPPSIPPPMIRTDVPPRMMGANEAMYQQQIQQLPPQHAMMAQQHPPVTDYGNSAHVHQQQRPGHPPTAMVVPNAQAGNGGVPPLAPKMQQIPAGHAQQLQTVVISQPPPTLTQPPPAQPSQQNSAPVPPPQPHQPPQQQQQVEHEQRTNDAANEAVKKSKLNPEAAEFRPQFLRQGSASSAGAPPMVSMVPNAAIMGTYPIPVQSPPSTPMMAQTPVPAAAVYGGVSAGATVPNQAIFVGGTANAYPQMPHSSAMSVQIVQGGSQPLYTIQAQQPPTLLMSNNNAGYRPRAAIAGPPQPAVAAATGQPIMATPFAQAAPYVLYNATNVHQAAQPHPGAPAGAAYQQNAYVVNPARMFAPQYVVPQTLATSEHGQQPYYAAVSPMVQMGPNSYPQAASVPSAMSVAQTMQQSNGNNNPSQTPPTSQQPTNPNSTAGPPPPLNSVSGNAPMNTTVIPYPPSAPTPQSPQYPTAPAVPAGAYAANMQYFVVPSGTNYAVAAAAPQLYNGQGGLATGAVQFHNAPGLHGYQAAAQPHYVADIAQTHFATVAAAQQAAAVAHHHAAVYHPTVLRSASVPSFAPGGPTAASVASASQGAPVAHQNNHS